MICGNVAPSKAPIRTGFVFTFNHHCFVTDSTVPIVSLSIEFHPPSNSGFSVRLLYHTSRIFATANESRLFAVAKYLFICYNDFKYERPNIDLIISQLEEIVSKLANETNVEVAKELVTKAQKISDDFQTMATLCSIRNTINTVDEFYEAETAFFDENTPKYQAASTKYAHALVNSPIRKELEEIYGV